ncbi:MAG: type II secretion system protein GspC [Gammaproteobacteria bacterium]|jgi:general secretion pathway protein C
MKDFAQDFTQRIWVGGLDSRLPAIAATIAVLLLSHSLARLTWNLVPTPEIAQQAAVTAQRQQRVQRVTRDRPLAQKISDLNLFGKYEPHKVTAEPVKPKVVPETKLNLKLRGVFASPDKKQARAIIADARGEEDSYRIGGEVPGGAILTEIHSDRVILERNGRLETLKLPVDEQEGGASNSRIGGRSTAPPPRRAVNRNINRGNIARLSSSTPDNSQLLGKYRDALLNDPNSMMGLVNVRPYQKDGRLVGYRIRPGRDRALLRRFGLRSGDIITSVNGVPMNNPVKALEVLRDLSSATQLTVDIQRNGTPQSFTFQIQ